MSTQSHGPEVTVVLTAADAAITQFISNFYRAYDGERHLLAGYYRDDSTLLWNGNRLTGPAALGELYARMPPTAHEVHSLDCHPVPAPALFDGPGAAPTAALLMATAVGQVRHGADASTSNNASTTSNSGRRGRRGDDTSAGLRSFAHQFLLRADAAAPDGYYIVNECVRFV